MATKKGFDTILDDVQTRNNSKASTSQQPEAQLNYKVPGDLKQRLDRAVYHKGPKDSQKAYLIRILTAALEADPDSTKPYPGE